MSIVPLSPLPDALLHCEVIDGEGQSVTIENVVKSRSTLLLFVRHFGCIGCSENIAHVSPRFQELHDLGVRNVIIGCGAPNFIQGFKERNRLFGQPVEVFTDPSLTAHGAAALRYGSWGGFGPRALFEMARAFVSGHVSGPIEGDTKQQAGAIFLDAEGQVQLFHRAESLGDHVNTIQLVETAMAMRVLAHPELV